LLKEINQAYFNVSKPLVFTVPIRKTDQPPFRFPDPQKGGSEEKQGGKGKAAGFPIPEKAEKRMITRFPDLPAPPENSEKGGGIGKARMSDKLFQRETGKGRSFSMRAAPVFLAGPTADGGKVFPGPNRPEGPPPSESGEAFASR